MPSFARDRVVIHYTEHAPGRDAGQEAERDGGRGGGFPVLLFAPGGMRSAAAFWRKAPWDPVAELSDRFRVIAMDQRNAGDSTAPVTPEDGWADYTADHLALLDYLGIARCHLVGGCIGGSHALGLMQAAPDRVAAVVLQQPIGFDGGNRHAFYEMFDSWAREIAPAHPGMTASDWEAFRSRMYDGDFVFNVGRDFVRGCDVPMLVLMGNDLYHPETTSREIARLARNAELVERWKAPEDEASTVARVRAFLGANTP